MSEEVMPLRVTAETLVNLHAATPESARQRRQDYKQHDGPCQKQGRNCTLPHAWVTYVDSRYVQGVLDIEVGPANWQDEYVLGDGGKVACRIGIFVEDRGWVWKGDGAGATDIEGDKGSFSDAFKRAAVKWGIARDLYDEKPSVAGTASTPVQNAPSAPETAHSAPQTQGAVSESTQAFDPPTCPNHGYAWTVGQYGPYCKSKAREGESANQRGYCNLKPNR